MCEYRLPKANIEPLGISLAPLAQISICIISPHPLSLALYVRISIAEGKYRAVRHITCAFGANIDLHNIPSSTADATAVRPLLGGAAPFSSRQRRATFPAIGKVYPTLLRKRGKVGRVRRIATTGLRASTGAYYNVRNRDKAAT